MPPRRDSILARIARRRSLRHWQAAADRAMHMGARSLGETVQQATALRRTLDHLLGAAAQRQEPVRADLPDGADWHWRPEVMRQPLTPPGHVGLRNDTAFGAGLKVFHDSRTGEITVHQRRDGTGWCLVIETYWFDGSFLSLVLDLPPDGAAGLSKSVHLCLSARLTTERPLDVYARLNLRCGPNTETVVLQVVPTAAGEVRATFDLSHLDLDLSVVQGAWVDLIVDAPNMNALTLTDIVLSRHAAPQF